MQLKFPAPSLWPPMAPAAGVFSAPGRHWVALPIRQVISSPAPCAVQSEHREESGLPCQHLWDEAARSGKTHPSGEVAGAVYPQEEFISPIMKYSFKEKAFIEMQIHHALCGK